MRAGSGSARAPRSRVARPTPRGWSFAAVGVAAIVVSYLGGRPEFVAAGVLLLLLPASAFLWVRLRRVSLSAMRTFSPGLVEAGVEAGVVLVIENRAQGAGPVGFWRDTWPWPPFAGPPAPLPAIPGRGVSGSPAQGPGVPGGGVTPRHGAAQARFDYRFRPVRRGVFEVGPAIVDFGDPFGLADGAVAVGGSQPIAVAPAVVELPDGALSLAVDEGPTRMPTRRSFGGEDDIMTREYRQGDAMRRVHWRATAHHGELMVRQEEQRDHAEVRIVLDTRRGAYPDATGADTLDEAESEAFEWSVAFAASLSSHLVRRGFQVAIAETGSAQLAPLDRPEEFRRSLAAIRLTDLADPGFSVLRPGARADRRQGSIFAILSEPDDELVARLVSHRRSFGLAIAFVVAPASRDRIEAMSRAGWVCVRVEPWDGVEEAWVAAGAEQGAARAGS